MRASMRSLFLAVLCAAALFAGVPLAAPEPIAVTPTCADAAPAHLFASWGTQLENLAFDGAGALYVSDIGGDHLLRVDLAGDVEVVASVPGMHGMVFGPDGLLYVGATAPEGGAGVWRFTSLSPPSLEFLFGGLEAANGMVFDAAGDLYVSSPLGTHAPYLVRSSSPYTSWVPWTDTYGPNGLVLDVDGSIIAAITGDQSSPIVRISTTDASDVQTIARLSLGVATLQPGLHAPSGPPVVLPKGLDDITLHQGSIFVVGHVSGEVLRVDPATGDACVIAAGLEEPTSLRVAHGFGPWDGALFVTDMGGQAVTALATPAAGHVWVIPLGDGNVG